MNKSDNSIKISKPTFGEYKGNPMISIPTNHEYEASFPFTFGRQKARAIMTWIDDIRAFAEGDNITPPAPAEERSNNDKPNNDDDDDDLPF